MLEYLRLLLVALSIASTTTGVFADEATVNPTERMRTALAQKQKVSEWYNVRTPAGAVREESSSRATQFKSGTVGNLAGGNGNPENGQIIPVPATSTWFPGDEEPKPGDLFRIVIPPRSVLLPAFRVSQILKEDRFLDLEHGFLVQGIDTRALSDGDLVERRSDGYRISELAGVVVGPWQYDTRGGGKKTVLHIVLAPHPDFLISEAEATDGYRLWTAQNGMRVVAKLSNKRGSTVRLSTRDKKNITVKLGELSEEDRLFLEDQEK